MTDQDSMALLERLAQGAELHHTAAQPQGRIVWRRWGRGAPVVLLHGGGGSWMHWVRNIEPLAQDHAVWAPDLPGFGGSDLPRDGIDADSIAPMIEAGARELLAGKPYALVGFSFGSLVASYMAAGGSPQIERLVLVSAHALGLMGPPPAMKSVRGVEDAAERDAILREQLLAMMIADPANIDAAALAIQHHGVIRERARGRKLARTDAVVRLAPQWRCPAFGVWGTGDRIFRNQLDALRATAARLPLRRSELIEGAGHWLAYEAADAFNPLLREFLAG